jgi:hypothetical protein
MVHMLIKLHLKGKVEERVLLQPGIAKSTLASSTTKDVARMASMTTTLQTLIFIFPQYFTAESMPSVHTYQVSFIG